jgi:hypothetical protein
VGQVLLKEETSRPQSKAVILVTMMTEDEVTDLVMAVQQGDITGVKNALRAHSHHSSAHNNSSSRYNNSSSNSSASAAVHANVRDGQNCTLLHWAAINNRAHIANVLIDAGAQVCVSGGLLEESPLMWAVRRKYYSMVDLLVRKGGVEALAHRSKQGEDALSLAYKLGEWVGCCVCG